jgi:hypothetical protein
LSSTELISLSQDDGTAALRDPGPAAALQGINSSLQSSFALYNSGRRSGSYSSSSSHMQLMGAAAVASSNAAVTSSIAPVVPCSIYFPGNRRTSKTLALAVPGVAHMPVEGAAAASWLGPVVTVNTAAAAAAATGCSALSEVVEAHRQLAAQQSRLEVMQQLLDDKEMLLRDARQMVSAAG